MHRKLGFVLAVSLAVAQAAAAQTPGYHVAKKIALPDGGWDYASVDVANRRLYLARTDGVTAVDLDSGAVTGKLVAAARGHEALPLANGELVVTNGTSGVADFVNAKTGAEIASVTVGKGPDAAIFDAKSGLVIVMNHSGGTVSLIDPKTHKGAGEIQVGGTLEFAAVDPAGHLFVNDEDAAEIAEVDLKAKKLMTRIKLTGCEGPTGLAYLPVAKRLVASCANGVAALVDPATAKFDKTLPVGKGPDAVIYDHARKMAFVPAGSSGDLTVLADEAKGVRVVGTIPTQRGARTGTVDEKTGKVYAAAADYDAPATAGGRPQMKPGSVVLLEIDP
jgi:DNA-binding beta-propeller fold protein YncE